MFRPLTACCLVLLVCGSVAADDLVKPPSTTSPSAVDDSVDTERRTTERKRADRQPAQPGGRYLVTIATYDSLLKDDKKSQLQETIQVSAMESQICQVEFGRQVSVITGRVTSGRGVSTQKSTISLGTILEATVVKHPIGAIVQLRFESSQHQGEGTDDSPPDVSKASVNTTMAVKLGEPTLIGSGSTKASKFIYLTVRQL